jgi:hypothetical protein
VIDLYGYCSRCQKIVRLIDIQTIRLPNLNYVHRGRCAEKGCENLIFKKIYDGDLIIDEVGHRYPKQVFVGESTPKKILNDRRGQKLIYKDKIVETTPESGKIITIEDIKQGVKANEKIKAVDP